MSEAATKVAGARRGRGLTRVDLTVRLLDRAETFAYWLAVAPLTARLPASLAYRVACWRGDLHFRYEADKRSEIVRNLRWVLGDQVGPEEAERLTRDFFRVASCEVIDVMRLRGRARSLGKLVEIRGREHLDAALAGGKGVILCSAHFGSHHSAFSLLHASGFPVTTIGRWYKQAPDLSFAERRFWDLVHTRRMLRHRQRPMIEPWPGQVQVAMQAAAALHANEVVTICSDAASLDVDLSRTVEVPLLGRQARLLPGVVPLSRLTGAPVLMAFVHRCADYRHQVLEISPPVPMQGDTATAFGRCVAAIDVAIRANPSHWICWGKTDVLVSLGLLPANLSWLKLVRTPAAAGDAFEGMAEIVGEGVGGDGLPSGLDLDGAVAASCLDEFPD
jgi:phosphatidylinositol dimannoside acyltransferase